MGRFNTRVKVFPGGQVTYSFYDSGIVVGEKREQKKNPLLDLLPPDGSAGASPWLCEQKARKRARGEVYDIAKSNEWDWFVTLTLSPERVNRWDYEACCVELVKFTRLLRDRGNQYVIVPEQHENGAWHFHGLVIGDLKLIPATSYWTGELLFDKQGRQVYNIKNYKYGLNTATAVGHSGKAAHYLAKYMLKDMKIPKGKKRYWASKDLKRPEVEYTDYSVEEQDLTEDLADYSKKINMKYGKLTLCDYRSEAERNEIAERFGVLPLTMAETPDIIDENDEDDIFVQIDPRFTWKPLEGEQLEIEQNINCCP